MLMEGLGGTEVDAELDGLPKSLFCPSCTKCPDANGTPSLGDLRPLAIESKSKLVVTPKLTLSLSMPWFSPYVVLLDDMCFKLLELVWPGGEYRWLGSLLRRLGPGPCRPLPELTALTKVLPKPSPTMDLFW